MAEYFRFIGRLPRKPFWLRLLACIAVMAGAGAVLAFLVPGIAPGPVGTGVSALCLVVIVIAALASLAAQSRRLRDRNKGAGWFLFFLLAPLVLDEAPVLTADPTLATVRAVASGLISLWLLIETGFLRGTPGPNRYGPDPLRARDPAEVFD